MTSRRLERQIDDALLTASVASGFVYVRRRVRRAGRRIAIGAAVAAGTGAAIAAAGAIGVAGGAAVRYRRRSQRADSR